MGKAVVSWNTALSFSPVMAKSSGSGAVFWPGCAALKLDKEIIGAAYEALQKKIPGLGFSTWCCGKPIRSVGAKAQIDKRSRQLNSYFSENHIDTIYTLCPNCHNSLPELFSGKVLSAWPLLAGCSMESPEKSKNFSSLDYILHDPCSARDDSQSQQAARDILSSRGVRFAEFENCRSKTRCCGRKNMIFLTNPEASEKMLNSRVSEAQGFPIISYCESCVEAFRSKGVSSHHLLEVMFDSPSSRKLSNRIKNKSNA